MNKILLGLLLFLFLSSHNFPQWSQTIGVNGGDVRAITYDDSLIFIGLNNGGIHVSSDQGISWMRRNIGLTNYNIESLYHSNGYLYAGVENTGLFTSSDQGNNWFEVPAIQNGSVPDIISIDSLVFVATFSTVYATSDNGQTWLYRGIGIPGGTRPSSLTQVGNDLFLGTSNGIYFSSDLGLTWTERSNGLVIKNINDITAHNDLVFAAISGDYVYATSDAGLNWFYSGNGLPVPNTWRITSYDSVLYSAPFGQGIYRSTDNGNSWDQFNNSYPNKTLTYSLEIIKNAIYAGGPSGLFNLELKDSVWNNLNENLYGSTITSIARKDDLIIAGSSGSKIFYSTDKGIDWDQVSLNNSFVSVEDIEIHGDSVYALIQNDVFFSQDLMNWIQLNSPSFQLNAITKQGNNIFVCGSNMGGVWASNDNGLSWELKNTGLENSYVIELCGDDQNLYAGTYDGIFISTDSGNNWNKITNGIPSNLYIGHIEIVDSIVYAGCSYGLYFSTDKGITWRSKGFSNKIVDDISGKGDFLAVIGYPEIYLSPNKGSSWQNLSQGLPSKYIYSVELTDSLLLAGTSGFGLWHRPLIVSNIDNMDNKLPEQFLLDQNYPNPFNPSTTIKNSLPEEGLVTLKIYNALGEEVKTLVNEIQSAGVYNVSFDASELSSGIYFYRIQANDNSSSKQFVETKKMILIK